MSPSMQKLVALYLLLAATTMLLLLFDSKIFWLIAQNKTKAIEVESHLGAGKQYGCVQGLCTSNVQSYM